MSAVRKTALLSSTLILLVTALACKKDSAAPTAATPPPAADTATFTITATPTLTSSPTITPTVTSTPTLTYTNTPACTVQAVMTPTPDSGANDYCGSQFQELGVLFNQTVLTGALNVLNDQDTFRFTAGTSGSYQFFLDCYTGTTSQAYLWLYADTCGTALVMDYRTGSPFALTRTLTAGTAYKIQVTGQGDGLLSQYRLTIQPPAVPACSTPTVTVTPEGTDASNACSTARALGTLTTGQIHITGTMLTNDNDYYSFQAGTTGLYTLAMDCLGDTATTLAVYDDTCVTSLADAIGTTVKTLTLPAVSGTTYRIHVGYLGTPANGGGYALRILAP